MLKTDNFISQNGLWMQVWGYIWPADSPDTKIRVVMALAALVFSKLIVVSLPLLYKNVIDSLDQSASQQALLVIAVPAAIIVSYGLLRVLGQAFAEIRDAIFTKVAQNAMRNAALKTFRHLHQLSLRYHLDRQTGGVGRALQRGALAIENLTGYSVFSVLPTLIEITLVCAILLVKYDWQFAAITFATILCYALYTIKITEWRVRYREAAMAQDEDASSKATDSLLNYETVKYFGNENLEERRYDDALKSYGKSEIKSQVTLSILNVGQGFIIAIGLVLVMVMSANAVADGRMSLGDFVLTNTYILQLYQPLDSLGWVYRMIKDSLVDMRAMLGLQNQIPEIRDPADAKKLIVTNGEIVFENVNFAYDSRRPILVDLNFRIPPKTKLAIVGESGSGKSTIARLLFRFYDPTEGRISIDGMDIRDATQESLRAKIGMVPQDTVLFNDTIAYNIAYGKPDAAMSEIESAARMAQLDEFIRRLPDGYRTIVGERGLKLSGGEKQRVAIARTLLKNPPLLVFDEATSALDSKTEKDIQNHLQKLAAGHTTIVIAHRLSTIIDADQIIVLDRGRVVERGTHQALLAKGGRYAELWRKQSAPGEGQENT